MTPRNGSIEPQSPETIPTEPCCDGKACTSPNQPSQFVADHALFLAASSSVPAADCRLLFGFARRGWLATARTVAAEVRVRLFDRATEDAEEAIAKIYGGL